MVGSFLWVEFFKFCVYAFEDHSDAIGNRIDVEYVGQQLRYSLPIEGDGLSLWRCGRLVALQGKSRSPGKRGSSNRRDRLQKVQGDGGHGPGSKID